MTNSEYASSITIMMCSGTASTSASTSSCRSAGPVGLFGVHSMIALVAGVIAARIASRSCTAPGPSGTGTGVAPVINTAMG